MFLSEMTRVMVRLPYINSVKRFVEIVNKSSIPADLAAGRYIVDARSIMGVFSLNLSESIEFRVHAQGKEADEMLESLKEFITDEEVPELTDPYAKC